MSYNFLIVQLTLLLFNLSNFICCQSPCCSTCRTVGEVSQKGFIRYFFHCRHSRFFTAILLYYFGQDNLILYFVDGGQSNCRLPAIDGKFCQQFYRSDLIQIIEPLISILAISNLFIEEIFFAGNNNRKVLRIGIVRQQRQRCLVSQPVDCCPADVLVYIIPAQIDKSIGFSRINGDDCLQSYHRIFMEPFWFSKLKQSHFYSMTYSSGYFMKNFQVADKKRDAG